MYLINVGRSVKGQSDTLSAGMGLGSLADWAAALAALAALALSLFALWIASRSSRRASLIALQERLDAREVSEGRRILYSLESADDVLQMFRKRHKNPEWDLANRAVNLWNTLAQFAKLGLVDKKLAFRLWGDSVLEAWDHVELFIVFRRGGSSPEFRGRPDKWSSLVWFAVKAGARVSKNVQGGLKRDERPEAG